MIIKNFPAGIYSALTNLRNHGFSFSSVVDVGAHKGEWANAFSRIFPNAKIVSFEPNPQVYPDLLASNPNSIQACLSRRNGESRTLYLPSSSEYSSTGVSMYRENGEAYDDPQVIEVQTRSLDSFGLPCDYLKLDVQGAELEVLAGGERTLGKANFCQLECGILQFNKGAPLIAEVIAYMHSKDFIVLEFLELLPHLNKLNQVDILFCKNTLKNLVSVR